MEGKREISEPVGRQSPEVTQWRKSLRDSQPGGLSTDSLRRSSSSLRKSTGNLAANFGTMSGKITRSSAELEHIESEYIKNLQQQVYFLELEANYLREQARKATEMHPTMSHEAERMLNKLRQMQAEVDGLHSELKRKDSSLDIVATEKDRFLTKLKTEEESHVREKRLLLEEVVQLKKQKDLLSRDCERKDHQIMMVQEQLNKSNTELMTSENKLHMIRSQLDQKLEQNKLIEEALTEKRTEQLKSETRLREMEDKFYSNAANSQEKLLQDLRDEIRLLRQKLKETEMQSDQDRYLRSKLSDDFSHLVKENALLNQQVIEVQKQLERERDLREGTDTRRSQSITELVILKDREKNLQFELNQAKEIIKSEKERVQHYMQQLSHQEHLTTQDSLTANTARARLAELESLHTRIEAENNDLRRDKMLLVDHVADLQKKLEESDGDVRLLNTQLRSSHTERKDLERLKTIESTLNTQKWDEFSRLAESMKNLSRTMAHTGGSGPTSPSRSSKLLEY